MSAAGPPVPPEPDAGALGGTVRRGAVLSAAAFVLVQAVSLGQIVVLARLLSPAEIGLYTAGTLLTGFVAAFSAGGMSAALVQRQDRVDDVTKTVFLATAAGGVISSCAVLGAAPVLALVFRSDVVGVIAAATAGTLFLHSLTVVPDSLIQRRFDFRRRLVVGPVIAVSYAVTCVVLAALGFGVWSLVWGTYVSHVCWLIATWSLVEWRPRRSPGRPSWLLWRELTRFSGPMIASGMVWRLREIIESVVVGRSLGDAALGQYRYGRRLSMLPGVAVVDIASYVLFPVFSRMARDRARLGYAYLRALHAVWLVSVPVAGMIVVVGQPLVVLALGEPWRGAGLAFAAMAGFPLGEALGGVADETVKGSGNPRHLYWITGVSLVATIGLLAWLAPFGLLGVGIAISVSNVAMGVAGVCFACRVTGTRLIDALAGLAGPAAAAALAVAVVWPVEHLVVDADSLPTAVGLAVLAGECVAVAAVYAVGVRVLAPSTVADLSGAVRALRSRRGPEGTA